MGLIPKTGRRSPQVRFLYLGMFLALTLGAVSMLLPFLLMLSGATQTGVDKQGFTIIPQFLYDDDALFRKHIEALHNESPANLRAAWGWREGGFEQVQLLEGPLDADRVQAWMAHASAWRGTLSPGYAAAPESRSRPLNVRRYIHHLKATISPEIHEVNRRLETDFRDWNAFMVIPPDGRTRLGLTRETPWWTAWEQYMREVAPAWTRTEYDLTGYYQERVWAARFGRADAFPLLMSTLPEGADEAEGSEAAETWTLFVREVVHPRFVGLDPELEAAWQAFLAARYVDLENLTRITGRVATRWEEVSIPERWEDAGPFRPDWEAFLQGWRDTAGVLHRAPASALRLESADLQWRERYGEAPPVREAQQWVFAQHRREIRRAFATQHFATVWEILIVDGRGVGNTVFYCTMAVFLALLVNPLAAYALSRYRPPNTYALLLFLLLTMAFPPMVTQIPVFLMLRDFGLLNTFWALLLPGMAHGYSIFLLKGFFDSLPRDLYESAALDGAGEVRMFWMITFSLSKPILAVIALSAFVSAYTNFMFALLICQDEEMWTLMVWLYQLQQRHGPGVMNAAFVLAALPTLLVFLLAQNQIMRGIVVPVEK